MIASTDLPSSTQDRSDTINRRGKLERTVSPQSVAWYPSTQTQTQTPSPSESIQSSTTKSVRFDRSVLVRLARSHRDYTPRQLKDCFYQSYELREIKNQCFEDLRRHMLWGDQEELEDYENETYCRRGLECFDGASNKHKHQLRAEAANKVFDAQDDGCDEYTIASDYACVTARSQMWANVLGLRDQRDAFAIHGQQPPPLQ